MKFNLNHRNQNYQIEIIDQNGEVKIAVNGKEFAFAESATAGIAPVAQAAIPKRDLSKKEIFAALAGTISELSVKTGDIVKAGQKLLTLSAMKMENEILSECDGKIKEIKVVQGQKVKEGDILIVLA